jgi:hypothetical protein
MEENRHNRRQFLGLSGIGLASMVGSSNRLTAASSAEPLNAGLELGNADLAVFNANVYTVDTQ